MIKINKKGDESTTFSLSFLIGLFFACVMIILMMDITFKLYDNTIGFNHVNKQVLVNYQRLNNDINMVINDKADIKDIFVMYSPNLIENDLFKKYVASQKSIISNKIMIIGNEPETINNQVFKNSILFTDNPEYQTKGSMPTKIYKAISFDKDIKLYKEGIPRNIVEISYNYARSGFWQALSSTSGATVASTAAVGIVSLVNPGTLVLAGTAIVSGALGSMSASKLFDQYIQEKPTKFYFLNIKQKDKELIFNFELQWKKENGDQINKKNYLIDERVIP